MNPTAPTAGRHTARAWHPVLLAGYPSLAVYAQNLAEVGIVRVFPWTAVSIVAAVLIWTTGYAVFKAPQRAALAASLGVAAFFSYGVLTDFREWLDANVPLHAHRVEAAALIVLLLAGYGFYRALRTPSFLNATTRFLNVMSAVLALLLVGEIATQSFRIWAATSEPSTPGVAQFDTSTRSELPDIYLILLDAYAGEDTLAELYGFDNQPFLDELERRGFHVQRLARSNYHDTVLSIASLLNMDYALAPGNAMHNAKVQWHKRPEDVARLTQSIRRSHVFDLLTRAGYHTTMFESGYEITEVPDADAFLRPEATLREFDFVLLNHTLLAPVVHQMHRARGALYGAQVRHRVLYIFEQLQRLPERPEPRFVFAHVPSPHRPLVFRADGSPRAPETEAELEEVFIRAYAEQLAYINRLTMKTVAKIQERSPEAIIIVQGDHGPKYAHAPRLYGWHDLTREYMGTINAIYFPDQKYDQLPDTFSQVNTFRVVFNRIFDLNFEPLADVSYFPSFDGSNELTPLDWQDGRAVVRRPVAAMER